MNYRKKTKKENRGDGKLKYKMIDILLQTKTNLTKMTIIHLEMGLK